MLCRARLSSSRVWPAAAASVGAARTAQLQRRCAAAGGKSYDVVIIGAGLVGNACALELRRKGFTTLNVDANPSPGYGSTSSSSSLVRFAYSLEDSCRLAWEGGHGWANWADYLEAPHGSELCSFREVGSLNLIPDSDPRSSIFRDRIIEASDAVGIPIEKWDAAEVRRRMPYLDLTSYSPVRRICDDRFGEANGHDISLGIWYPNAGYVDDPQLAARNLAEAAIRHGADFRWKSQVTSIIKDAAGASVQGVMLKDGSVVHSGIVINAAGPHSSAVHKLAFDGSAVGDDSNIHSQPLRVEVAYIPEPPEARIDETMPVMFDTDIGCYYRPQKGGQMVIGSLEPECDELHFLNAPEEINEGLTDEWTNLVHRVALRIPSLRVPNSATGLSALYDNTPDWTPIYDRTSLGRFYSMRGTTGNQFKNAPVVGRICAHLVESCENGHDHDSTPLELPLHHAGGNLGLEIFSRMRKPASTSGSVLG